MDKLTEFLAHLENHDLIQPQQNGAMAYGFKHVFTQESVYSSLLRSDRRQIHGLVGQAIEAWLGQQPPEGETTLTLAYHFEQAEQPAKALPYLTMAAAQAAAAYANTEALQLYHRALAQLTPEDYVTRWDILQGKELILDRLGQREMQVDTLIQLQTLADLLQDKRRQTLTHHRRAVYFDKISEYQAAAEAADVGLRIARRSGNRQLQAQSLNLLALAAWRRFDYRQVQRWAEEALANADDPADRITGLFHLGKASYRLGQYDLALRYLQTAQELTHHADNKDNEATSHMILGWIYQRLGNYQLAETHFQTKLAIRRAIGDQYGQATALSHLGWLAYDQHTPTTGLDYCRQALDISRAIGDRENEAYALSGMGLNYEQLGQLAEAARSYQTALEIHTDIGATTLAIFDRTGLARIALAQNNPDLATTAIAPVTEWVLTGNAQKFWDPWIIYLSAHTILTELGHLDAADTILNEAHTVLHQRAHQISDAELRHCFLEKVAANKMLEQAWATLHPGAHA